MAKTATIVAEVLDALADPTRRKILDVLKEKGCCAIGKPFGMCACDIEQKVGLSQPTVSHHMSVLRKVGLVEAEKLGQWMWYRRNEKALKEFTEALAREL